MGVLLGALGLLLALGLGKFAADTMGASAAPGPKGIGAAEDTVCKGEGLVPIGDTGLCTHGPDPAPPGFDAAIAVEPALGASATPSAITCEGDGVSGKRVEVIYARASDVANRYDEFLPSFRQWAADADTIYRNSAAQTGGSRAIRYVTSTPSGGSCPVVVRNVVLSTVGDDDFDDTIHELAGLGYNKSNRKYLIFMDATQLCGIGNFTGDARRHAVNLNNVQSGYSRVDAGCWDGHTAAHELGHNLGAVLYAAPNTSLGAHCVDEYDVMCYSDDPYYPDMRTVCTPESTHELLLDCNKDDYFHTNPASGSFLDQFWNIAFSQFLIGATDRPAPGPPINDAVAQPLRMTARPFLDTRDVSAATVPAGETKSTCESVYNNAGINSVWYTTTPATGGTMVIDTAGSAYDSILTVYSKSGSTLTPVTCNDDPSGSVYQARLSFTAVARTTYVVKVSGYAYDNNMPSLLRLRLTGPGEGAGTGTLALDKVSSKFNGEVIATLAGFAPNSAVTLTWPRLFAVTPTGAPSTDLLVRGTTDGAGAARLRFRTPLEPFNAIGYLITARDATGRAGTASLRVIPRIMLNETSGSTTTRLRVYFYGFAPNERIEVRWHTGATNTTSFAVLKTLTVAANGRASSIVVIPSNAAVGRHLIVGKVIGVSRSASTSFTVTVGGGSVGDPTATPTAEPSATPVPTETATPEPTATVEPVPTETATPEPTATVEPTAEPVPTETPTPEPTATETPVPNASPVAVAGEDQTVTDTDGTGDEAVTLDGSASTDPEGGELTYSWTVGGLEVATGASPSVTLPVGETTVLLTVTDGQGLIGTDEVAISVASAAEPTIVENM